MPGILRQFLDLVLASFTPFQVVAVGLVLAALYIWYLFHRQRILEERLTFSEERRKATAEELERVYHRLADTSDPASPKIHAILPQHNLDTSELKQEGGGTSSGQDASGHQSWKAIQEQLGLLREEAELCSASWINYELLPSRPTWQSVRVQQWYRDLVELGKTTNIDLYFRLLDE